MTAIPRRDRARGARAAGRGPRLFTLAARLAGVAVIGAFTAMGAGSASAHHSFAMFDRARTIDLTGEVREFQWVNPHTWIQLVVPGRAGAVEWSIEGRSPNVLSRRGWTRNSLKPGERITATVYPLKNGKPGGAIISIRFQDGRVLNADTPTAVDTNEEGPR